GAAACRAAAHAGSRRKAPAYRPPLLRFFGIVGAAVVEIFVEVRIVRLVIGPIHQAGVPVVAAVLIVAVEAGALGAAATDILQPGLTREIAAATTLVALRSAAGNVIERTGERALLLRAAEHVADAARQEPAADGAGRNCCRRAE